MSRYIEEDLHKITGIEISLQFGEDNEFFHECYCETIDEAINELYKIKEEHK